MNTCFRAVYPGCSIGARLKLNKKQTEVTNSRRFSQEIDSKVSVELAKKIYGQKQSSKTAVILHGLFGAKNNWHRIAKALYEKTSIPIITADLRNHGDSPHSFEMTYNHMAKDVKQLIINESILPAVVMGHSMGGRTAMHLALCDPDTIQQLIVLDMHPLPLNLYGMLEFLHALQKIKIEKGTPLSEARKVADKALYDTIPQKAVRDFMLTNLAQAKDGTIKWKLNIEALIINYNEHISNFYTSREQEPFQKPTAFVMGENSVFANRNDEWKIKNFFPTAEFFYIKGAGHWLHAERPKEVIKILSSLILRK